MNDQFVHLHVHSEYSMLDGAARIKELLAEAKRLGMPAAAITDHGNMHGAFDFYKQATAAGVTPVIGVEAYVAPESRLLKQRVRWGRTEQKKDDVSGNGSYTHMTMWARNAVGLNNLFRLNSRASLEGQYGKYPRMDYDIIAEHAEGLMATTGCPSGAIQTRLRLGQFEAALAEAARYKEVFGDDYWLEIMDHGLEIERRVRDGLLEIGQQLDIKPLVTNDSHYVHEHQSAAHDVLLCVQTGSNIADPTRFRFDGSGYFIKSAEQMRAVDTSDAWSAGCANTLLVAERVDTSGMFTSTNLMPRFPIPDGFDEAGYFRHVAYEGLARRYPGGIPDDRRVQADYELGVITDMGFPSYFLVVADFIGWAKAQGITVGPGRGSAAGSLIAYAMGITDIDPMVHGLIFERFLNPERVSMPDVDIDFDDRRRGEVIDYVTTKWGAEYVAQIGTFGTIKAKAAIKDSSRVLGFGYALGDEITKAYPKDIMGKSMDLDGILNEDHKRYSEAVAVRDMYHGRAEVKKVIDTARGIEGLIRQTGVHAAGVIMSAEPIIDHVPLSKRVADGAIITQFDYPTCETLGLLKMDFLGLRNLTILADATRNVETRHGTKLDLISLTLDDPQAFDLLARGDTLGVFQLDGGPMRSLLKMMKPDDFEDISAVLALYRPGPMGVDSHTNYALRKNGLQEITPIHPELEEPLRDILEPTYGLIVYQEQVQRAAQILAGYSLGKADLLRRAMGKKKQEELDAQFVGFQEGCRANGYSDEAIQAVWDVLVPFAGYAFNKAHSAAYGVISYQTAWMKAHYPAEYMAALLTSVGDDKDKMALYLAECRRMGIKVRLPDVNVSEHDFTATADTEIRFGLKAVKDIGDGPVAAIIAGRADGPYLDFADFLDRAGVDALNAKAVEALVKAGGFDGLGHTRAALYEIYKDAVKQAATVRKKEDIGQYDLFGTMLTEEVTFSTVVVPDKAEWEKLYRLDFEKEMLGLFVSGHPLDDLAAVLAGNSDHTIASAAEAELADREIIVLAGQIIEAHHFLSRNKNEMAKLTFMDLTGVRDIMAWGKVYPDIRQHLHAGANLALRCQVLRRDGEEDVTLAVVDVAELDMNRKGHVKGDPVVVGGEAAIVITATADQITADAVDRLTILIADNPGDIPVVIKMIRTDGVAELWRLDDKFRVAPSGSLTSDVKALFGRGALAG